MRDIISRLVQCGSWLFAILTSLATVWWIAIVADGNHAWSAFAFTFGMAPCLTGSTLLAGVFPSGYLYFKNKRRRDWMSLLLAGCSFLVVFAEVVIMNIIIPQKGE